MRELLRDFFFFLSFTKDLLEAEGEPFSLGRVMPGLRGRYLGVGGAPSQARNYTQDGNQKRGRPRWESPRRKLQQTR